jgi:hypothetical protein
VNCILEGGAVTGTPKTGMVLDGVKIYHDFNKREYRNLQELCELIFPEWASEAGVTHSIENCKFIEVVMIKENE